MNARCMGCRFSPPASPSAVTISASWCATARARQLFTRRPSSRTVQAPHCPWSQPFLGPVSPRRSRSASRSVVRVSMKSWCAAPFTWRVIFMSILHVPPLYTFVLVTLYLDCWHCQLLRFVQRRARAEVQYVAVLRFLVYEYSYVA